MAICNVCKKEIERYGVVLGTAGGFICEDCLIEMGGVVDVPPFADIYGDEEDIPNERTVYTESDIVLLTPKDVIANARKKVSEGQMTEEAFEAWKAAVFDPKYLE